MIFDNKLQRLFFSYPMHKFGVRELSRKTKTDTKTVMKYLKELIKQKIIIKKKEKGKYPYYEANRLSRIYRYEKSYCLVKEILKSGLVEFLEEKINPKAIVLFGSAWRGTYHQDSYIDIFVYSDESRLNLTVYEKKLDREIQLLFEDNLKNLPKGLIKNIKKGYIISGDLN